MLKHFCTLFNSAYLSRGLALYRSLCHTTPAFHLYVFAFDDATFEILKKLDLAHMTVIPLSDLEEPALLAVKPERTLGEYCWTCTPATILYCLEHFKLPQVCYLDADIYFWDDPAILLSEMDNASVLLTEHRFSPEYDNTERAGKYCIQFMGFKNDPAGLKALMWWKDACIEWCYDRVEPGRFGDQKYCDDWLERFEGVVVLEHLGGGVAPWNVQQYQMVNAMASPPLLGIKNTNQTFYCVFYHFHALRFVNNEINFGHYQLSQKIINTLYQPYVDTLLSVEQDLLDNPDVSSIVESLNIHGRSNQSNKLTTWVRMLKQKCFGQYHAVKLKKAVAV